MPKFISYEKNELDRRGNPKLVKLWMWSGYVGTNPNDGSKFVTKRRDFHSQKEAANDFTKLKAKFLAGNLKFNDSTRTFKSVYIDWLDQYKHTVRSSTLGKVKTEFRLHINPALGGKPIGSITVKDCQQIVNSWFEEGLGKYRQIKNDLSRVFKYAVNIDLIKQNPIDKIIVPRPKEKIEIDDVLDNFYERDELIKFMNVAKSGKNKKAYVLFRVLAFTGIRKGEALALTWSDIDLNHMTMKINKAVTRNEDSNLEIGLPKTKASIRSLDLDPITVNALKHWKIGQAEQLLKQGIKADEDGAQLVFNSEDNAILSPARPRKWIIEIAKQAGLTPITVHGFRHTHASLLFEAGVSIKEAQSRLGHSNYQTTANIYTHVTKKMKMETGKKFAAYVDF